MGKFKLANCDSAREGDVVIVGVPTDAGARSERKGRSEGPDRIREVSAFLYDPEQGTVGEKIYDAGNLEQKNSDIRKNLEGVAAFVFDQVNHGKRLIVLGGDCSIKHGIGKGLNQLKKILAK